MNKKELQNRIVGQFYSEALKKKIKEEHFVFDDTELVKVIYNCAKNHNECVFLLESAAECLDAQAAKLALYTVKKLREQKKIYHDNSQNCAYELSVIDQPGKYNEKYLCSSYASALKQLDWFAEYYADVDAVIDEKSRIEITKRRIFGEDDERDEDYLGSALIDSEKNVLEYNIENFNIKCVDESACDKYESCNECKEVSLCNRPKYPQFLKNGDIVRYLHAFGRKGAGAAKYGLTIYNRDDEMISEFYVIKFDNEYFKQGNFAEYWNSHTHVYAPDTEKAEYSELPEELKKVYDGLWAYIKKDLMKMNIK